MQRRGFLTLAAGLALAPTAARSAPETIRLRDLYNRDLSFSDFALERADAEVAVSGFMAPPLKAESRFFVLTKMPMAVCPFCESEAEWPDDIVSVYTHEVISVVPFNYPIVATGVLRLGTYRDEELGFVSRVRLTEANFHRE